jgi:peptidoglycan/LPS O-acetylase OafA/YrhL
MAGTERRLSRGGALDALRFAAAAFITLYHFGAEEAPVPLAEIHPAFGRGFLATDFFLILSGYILARAYGARIAARGVDARGFFIRRLARIWPAHLIVLAGFAAVVLAAGLAGVALNNPQSFSWDGLARQAVFAHAWGLGPEPGWNSATWTLSALVVCYAAFPFVWRSLARLNPTGALALGLGVLGAADLLARAAGTELYTLAPAYGVGRGAPLFLLGACVARFSEGFAPARATAWILGLGGMAALVVSQGVGGWGFVSMVGIAAVILAAGTHAPRRSSKMVERAAALSFSLFITHNLIGLVWFRAVKLAPWELPETAAWAAWALIFPVSLLSALMFDRCIDSPMQAWLKPRLAGRKAAGRARGALIQPA